MSLRSRVFHGGIGKCGSVTTYIWPHTPMGSCLVNATLVLLSISMVWGCDQVSTLDALARREACVVIDAVKRPQ